MKKYGTCLLVDDEADLLDALQAGMEGMFLRVDTCADGQCALKELSSKTYDLIISDVQMPIMRGDELLRAVRSQGSTTPFIYMSGNVSKTTINELTSLGDIYFIPKPFDFDMFFSKVDEVMSSLKK